MNEDLRRERNRTSFDTKELSAILYGGEESFKSLKRIGLLNYRPEYSNNLLEFKRLRIVLNPRTDTKA